MKKRTKVPHVIKECIAAGMTDSAEIAKEIGYSKSHVVSVIGEMIANKDLIRIKLNNQKAFKFGHTTRLHDPFNLCKPAYQQDKAA